MPRTLVRGDAFASTGSAATAHVLLGGGPSRSTTLMAWRMTIGRVG